MKRLLIALALLSLSSFSHADVGIITGDLLYSLCLGGDLTYEPKNPGFCEGYVIGVVDQSDLLQGCIPSSVPGTELIDTVKKYLADHPNDLNFGGWTLVTFVLGEAYNCEN
jgi:hypothetical protein